MERADAEKDFMGLLTFRGKQPTLAEARTAKNYLDNKELRSMGQLVSGYLDFYSIRRLTILFNSFSTPFINFENAI